MNARSQSSAPISCDSHDRTRAADSAARVWADRRDESARAIYARGVAARDRALALLAAEAARPDAVGLASSVARDLGEHARIAARAGLAAVEHATTRPAHAARSTRDLTAALESGAPISCAYALDRDVTGAIPPARMRVRAPGKRTGHAATVCRDASPRSYPAADTMTGARDAARGQACAKVRDLVRTYQTRKLDPRAGTARVRADIVAILDTWQGDAIVYDAARSEGWTIK